VTPLSSPFFSISSIFTLHSFTPLSEHDFFQPNPVPSASVYILRTILHDWTDADSLKIISAIRTAAAPESKLIVFDGFAEHTCEDPDAMAPALGPKPPAPLLANMGVAGAGITTAMDIMVGSIRSSLRLIFLNYLGKLIGSLLCRCFFSSMGRSVQRRTLGSWEKRLDGSSRVSSLVALALSFSQPHE
jgi:hypothetical protein